MTEDENVMKFVNALTEFEKKLASIRHNVPKEEIRRSLLRGLREEFEKCGGYDT